MTEKKINNNFVQEKLSIQLGLNGLSFFVEDMVDHSILLYDNLIFEHQLTPFQLLKELKSAFKKHGLEQKSFAKLKVVHLNDLYTIVPKSLFDDKELANYLKFNTKLLPLDELVYDEIPHREQVCVYVPFTTINNYLLSLYDGFDFQHLSTHLLSYLYKGVHHGMACIVHLRAHDFSLVIIEDGKLQLYNQFTYENEVDFLYYVLFCYEQMKLNPHEVPLHYFGQCAKEKDLIKVARDYIIEVKPFTKKDSLPELLYQNHLKLA